ncbi:NUDIX domain-containing protein [Reinekea sp. G2M2-21]|uniref:NUDIX domain-containing protein n=1 Tax=Reinekea sp. G2M2-21 TaxID=2788942 RepID=UPI0018A8E135|nr:NUDIX domain-containing protein [Reinekea sp. G2M2-21]
MSYPHLVVAVVCVEDGKMLMVKEVDNNLHCWNQPAGHVEVGESLEQAAVREALEETGYRVELLGLHGIYQGVHKESGTHYVRICFRARAAEKTDQALDADILEAQWLQLDDLRANKYPLRSELARQTLEDLANEPIVPLSLINEFFSGVTQ